MGLAYSYFSIDTRKLFRYFLSDLEMFPVAPVMTGITFVFTFHICCIPTVRSSHIKIFSASFLITFLPPKIEMSSRHVTSAVSRITMS
jgi:hypothetical protein